MTWHKPRADTLLRVACVLWPLLSLLYYLAVRSLYDDVSYYNHKVPVLCEVLVVGTMVALVVGLLLNCLIGCHLIDDCPVTVQRFQLLHVVWVMFGTVVYLLYMVRTFPYACEFQTPGSHGEQIVIDYESGERTEKPVTADFEMVVDCHSAVTVFKLRDGREVVSILAHMLPILFAVTMSALEKVAGSDMTVFLMDSVDMQDFFLLLTEDDIILAYWGLEHRSWIYLWISTVFVLNAFYLLGWPVLQMCLLSDTGMMREKKIVERMSSLLLFNIPYFMTRWYCSTCFNIVASSLFIKNAVCICTDVYGLYKACTDSHDDDSEDENDHDSWEERPIDLTYKIIDSAEKYKSRQEDTRALLDKVKYKASEDWPTITAGGDSESSEGDGDDEESGMVKVKVAKKKMEEAADVAAGKVAEVAARTSSRDMERVGALSRRLLGLQEQIAGHEIELQEKADEDDQKVDCLAIMGGG